MNIPLSTEQSTKIFYLKRQERQKINSFSNSSEELREAYRLLVENGFEVRSKEEKNEIANILRETDTNLHPCETHLTNKDLYFKCFLKKERNMLNNLKPHDVSRLILLATYISTDNNYLKFDTGDKRKMTTRDLIDVLKISESTAKRTISALTKNGYLIKEKDGYRICDEYFHRGKDLLRPLGEGERYTRLYHETIRRVYYSLGEKGHKYFGSVCSILYYTNINHNVLCENPFEPNIENIVPLSLTEFAEKMNITDKTNLNKFMRDLFCSMNVNFDGKSQPIVMRISSSYVKSGNEVYAKDFVMINPELAYGGKEKDKCLTSKQLFKYINKWVENKKRFLEYRKSLENEDQSIEEICKKAIESKEEEQS